MRPGYVVQALPIAARAWASLLPMRGRPWRPANSTAATMPVLADRRGVEGLDRVRVHRLIVVVQQPAQGPALRGQVERDERVRRDRDAALVVDRLDRPAEALERRDARLEEQARRGGPPSVVISSPTTTSNGSPRSAAIARPASAASIRSWSAIAMTSRKPVAATWSRTSTTDAVPSDASVWMWRSARPRRATGSVVTRRPSPGPVASGVVGAWRACRASGVPPIARSGQIGWNAPHHCSGASPRMLLEHPDHGRRHGGDALAPRARLRRRHADRRGSGSGRPSSAGRRRPTSGTPVSRASIAGRPGSAPGGRRTGSGCRCPTGRDRRRGRRTRRAGSPPAARGGRSGAG